MFSSPLCLWATQSPQPGYSCYLFLVSSFRDIHLIIRENIVSCKYHFSKQKICLWDKFLGVGSWAYSFGSYCHGSCVSLSSHQTCTRTCHFTNTDCCLRTIHFRLSETVNSQNAHGQTSLECCHRVVALSQSAQPRQAGQPQWPGEARLWRGDSQTINIPNSNYYCPWEKTFTEGHCLCSTAHKGVTNLLKVGNPSPPQQVKVFRLQVQENPFAERRQQIPSAVERTKLSSPQSLSDE